MTTQLQTELNQLDEKILSTPSENSENSRNPPFPVEAFPQVMKSIITEASSAAQVPESLSGMVAMACVSTAIGGGLVIESTQGRTLNGNLHILAVAKSGTGKGSVYGMIAKPLNDYNAEEMAYWKAQTLPNYLSELAVLNNQIKTEKGKLSKGTGSEDELREKTKEVLRIEELIKIPPRLLVGETTEQALGMTLSGQPHEAIGNFSAEARGLIQIILGKFGSGSDSTGETLYCAGYSGDAYSIERAGRADLCLSNPCLSVLFMLQPDSMKKLTTSDAMTLSGFLPRFIMADVKADLQEDDGQDRSVQHDTKENWSDLLNDLLDFYRKTQDKIAVKVSHEASELLRVESNRIKRLGKFGASLDRFSSYVSRYGENLRKIHLVLHVAEHGNNAHTIEASAESARNAIKIANWFFHEMLSLLKDGMMSKLQERLNKIVSDIGKIEGDEPKEITLGVMKKSHTTTEADIRELQYFFPNTLEIVDRKQAKGGRPTKAVRLVTD